MDSVKKDIQNLIKSEFPMIKSQEDLLRVLNSINENLYSRYFLSNNKTVPKIELKTLTFYKNPKVSGNHRYKTFTIKKKSGKDRVISAPAKGLKLIQQCLNEIFQAYYEPNDYACGFVPGRNIVDGAKMHTNMPYVLNLDLKDFFDTITFPRVKKVLSLPPYNLNGDREKLGYIITSLCCHPKNVMIIDGDGNEQVQTRNCLPQGAPTSPILTNIVCRSLDRHLAGLARRFHANYSRYADDITFSCHYNIFKKDSEFSNEVIRIIEEEQGLTVNQDKTRLQTPRQRQEVTGLIVNKKVNVTKRYVKQIRLWLHYWEVFGLKRAQQYFIKQYLVNRENFKNTQTAQLENVLAGKLDFMRMVVGEANHNYKQLKERYETLVRKDIYKNKVKRLEGTKTDKAVDFIATSDGIQRKPQNEPFVPNEELEVLLNGLIDDLENDN